MKILQCDHNIRSGKILGAETGDADAQTLEKY